MIHSNSVRFSNIEIRLYDPCMSDNPSCSNGPPIGIDWTYIQFNERALKLACRKLNTTMQFRASATQTSDFNPLVSNYQSDLEKLAFNKASTKMKRRNYEKFNKSFNHNSSKKSITQQSSTLSSELVISVDEYEANRSHRSPSQLIISSERRRQILAMSGYSDSEIASTSREARKANYRRMRTFHNLNLMNLEERIERITRALRRCTVRSRNKRKTMRSNHLYEEWKNKSSKQIQ